MNQDELNNLLKDNPHLKIISDTSNNIPQAPSKVKVKSLPVQTSKDTSKPDVGLNKRFTDIKILEKDFAQAFDDLATLRGWTWCGFRPARQKIDGEEQYRTPLIGQKGLPDRILARNGVVLLVELKTNEGRLSEGQKIWANALKGVMGYYVLKPSDWDFIDKLLI